MLSYIQVQHVEYPVISGILFTLAFCAGGALCGVITTFYLRRVHMHTTKVINVLTIFSLINTATRFTLRISQTILNYHALFREGFWLVPWTLFFTVGFYLCAMALYKILPKPKTEILPK